VDGGFGGWWITRLPCGFFGSRGSSVLHTSFPAARAVEVCAGLLREARSTSVGVREPSEVSAYNL
jgi:hypothetical protein